MQIAAGGFALQLLSMPFEFSGTFGLLSLLLFFGAVGASVLTFTNGKDYTSRSNGFAAAMVVAAIISASIGFRGPGGVIMMVIGVAVSFFGNKQLAAALRA